MEEETAELKALGIENNTHITLKGDFEDATYSLPKESKISRPHRPTHKS
jgi:hypothetical protein